MRTTARALAPDSAVSTLGEVLGLGAVDQHELYAAMDWLVQQQAAIEQRLAKRHLRENTLVLYDLTSSYLEGTHCPLAKRGYSRDGKPGTLQIVFGLLCTAEGCPVAVEVFEGSTSDPKTVACQVVYSDNQDENLPTIRMRESPPLALLGRATPSLPRREAATTRKNRPLRGAAEIGLRVGKVINRHKVAKHFVTTITDDTFTFHRDDERIATGEQLDGLYIVRSNVEPEQFDAAQTVRAYKDLSKVERAFRSLKSVDLKIRPIHHRRPDRVRAHVLLCMLAYWVEWHMRQALAPLLFDDHDPAAAEQQRRSVVEPAKRSPAALAKAGRKRTDDHLPVHSFRTLLADLGTLTANTMQVTEGDATFRLQTQPTPMQQRCFELLGVTPQL